jgi:hypothetical protein
MFGCWLLAELKAGGDSGGTGGGCDKRIHRGVSISHWSNTHAEEIEKV